MQAGSPNILMLTKKILPEEGLPNDVEAENKYFAKKEEEVCQCPGRGKSFKAPGFK